MQEYPYVDFFGTKWISPSSFEGKEEGNCFMCNRMTRDIDINFGWYFCDSAECNQKIDDDLKRLI